MGETAGVVFTGRRGRVDHAQGDCRGIGLGSLGAGAEATSETLYSIKDWNVQVVGFDDGTVSCLAQVTHGSISFSMWSGADELVELQFYDEGWDLGEGQTADLKVQVDNRAVWNLSNAELHLQSVFFNIPDSNDGIDFMNEVMAGDVLYLANDTGDEQARYSLAGSRAAVGALIECVGALKADTNPFN